MCYHVSTPSPEETRAYLNKVKRQIAAVEDYERFYHVSGFAHPALPVMLGSDPTKIQPAMWGFVPHFARDRASAQDFANKTLNAKVETAWDTPMYRAATPKQRCLIFVEGFYEWRWDDAKGKTKVPHFIYMPDKRPFALGGLWNDWPDPETGEVFRTCSIYTTEANELMATIHNNKKRMPLIVPEDSWDSFISPDSPREVVKSIMRPYPDGALQAHEISKLITSRTQNPNVPEVQEPVEPSTLF